MAGFFLLYRTKWPITIYIIGQKSYHFFGDKNDFKRIEN